MGRLVERLNERRQQEEESDRDALARLAVHSDLAAKLEDELRDDLFKLDCTDVAIAREGSVVTLRSGQRTFEVQVVGKENYGLSIPTIEAIGFMRVSKEQHI